MVTADVATYYLYRNRLIDADQAIEFDPSIPDSQFPTLPVHILFSEDNGTPRNFLVGDFDENKGTLIYRSAKYVSPRLNMTVRNEWFQPSSVRDDEDEFGLKNVFNVYEIPWEFSDRSAEAHDRWNRKSRFHFKLDPPLELSFVPADAVTPPLEAGEKLVQGMLELGGGVVCGRKEEGVLTLYRLPACQNTHPDPIQVFNPGEKLVWDTSLSDKKLLAALLHLRADLLEHNTGVTENRLYVRMKPYAVKLDKPGTTKALRDWYLLAPFYDPATNTYREALAREDFVADAAEGFDPNAADFNPSLFARKLVPYVLPEGFWTP